MSWMRRNMTDVEKKLITRSENVNWMISADETTKDYLLQKKRICLNYDRIRIVQYIPIIRCFNCQAFGHMKNK